jgi:peptidoglycan/xylan/chitin deacetylase (PgdA/CDA1 family)
MRMEAADKTRLSRLTAFVALLTLLTLLTLLVSPGPSGAAGSDLRKATVTQKGRAIVFAVNPSRAFALSRLSRRPDLTRPKARFLCVEMRRRGARRLSRICVGGPRSSRTRAVASRALPGGKAIKSETIPVRVSGSSTDGLTISFVPARARLTPGRYAWRVIFSSGACQPTRFDCRSSYPEEGFDVYRLRPVIVVGCTGGNGEVVRSGPGGRRMVALTFDDGPSDYTPEVLKILRNKRAKATFFMLGQQVAADPAMARKVLAAGHEIGNHSYSHPLLPGYSELSSTSRTIRKATDFKPCLFRPPYGAINSSVISSAKALEMKSVIWSVDTVDWSTPGTDAIRSRATAAGRGSIVLMHDGGGPRSQTVAALPGIIDSLRGRGYKLVTVTRLLGNRFIYRPR